MTKQFEADVAKQETFWAEQKASWAKQEASWAKQEASWAKQEEGWRMEVLRAQGKLSSRGIFERFLELVAAEQGLKGLPNATTTIKKVRTMDVQNLGKGEF